MKGPQSDAGVKVRGLEKTIVVLMFLRGQMITDKSSHVDYNRFYVKMSNILDWSFLIKPVISF